MAHSQLSTKFVLFDDSLLSEEKPLNIQSADS